jgi:hypothetical protein
MTARDLFTEELNTPREGHGVLKGEKPTPSASTESPAPPSTLQVCGQCNLGRLGPSGFVFCAVGPKETGNAPGRPCVRVPIQFTPITAERLAARAALGKTPEVPAPSSSVDSRETSQYQIRDTSMHAIWQLRADGKITERQKELLEFYAEQVPTANFTRQEIARYMMNRHGAKWAINQVCGRVNECIKLGRLREIQNSRRCTVTGELVNAVERGVW